MNKGDIVLVPFPFTDLSQAKLRPALVLWVNTPFPLKDYRLYSSSSLAFFASWRFIK